MKYLVTGGGGFLGGRIVRRLLERGDSVVILGRKPQPELQVLGAEMIQGSMVDGGIVEHSVRDCDAVFHVAAKAGVWGSWKSFYEPNVVGTENVLNACKRNGIRYLVYTSTPSVVYNGEPFEGEDESLPYGKNWICHYAHTKAIAEKKVLKAHNMDGLRTCALRPHLIWGAGDPHLLPRVIETAGKGRLPIVGRGENRVDITHVDNAADAHLLAMESLIQGGAACGKAYFLSQGKPVQLWPWINALLERVGMEPITKKVSLKKAFCAGAFLEVLWKLGLPGEPPLTRFATVELAKSHWYNISAARRDFGYEPKVTNEQGLDEFVAWYQEQKHGH
jgi:nucleoside-diphosphate-sugar epimerase